MSAECKLKVAIGHAQMSAKFPTAREAMIVLIAWVESEAETCLSGTVEERFAAARKWIEGLEGGVEITDSGECP